MKSSADELIKRGYIPKEDYEMLKEVSIEQVLEMLTSKVEVKRTTAVIELRKRYSSGDKEYTKLLLEMLSREKALYTKLEICNSLEMGNEDTAKMMCEYIGIIGNNQHKKVPNCISKKTSYPLPRDIIARSLGKMNKSVIGVLSNQLGTNDSPKTSELIDAFGFLIFYNQELATEVYLDVLKKIFKRFINDELVVWKIAICCSAFPLMQCSNFIDEISKKTSNQTIILETQRSLELIARRSFNCTT